MDNCIICNLALRKPGHKYCSNKCEATDKYNVYIQKWRHGAVTGSRGINTKNISGHIRRYLIQKYGEKCIFCGWNKKNILTGKVPLEVDHINGNAEDNSERNLRLICPNCHSLSINFRNLNHGHGRKWRSEKYIKASV